MSKQTEIIKQVGYELEVLSWENDADYQTHNEVFQTKEDALFVRAAIELCSR